MVLNENIMLQVAKIQKAVKAWEEADIEKLHVSISKSNDKMDGMWSVSLPPVITCKACECMNVCYAVGMLWRTLFSWTRNWVIYKKEPDKYWREVEAAIMTQRFFRFHVGGEIPDYGYLLKIMEIAEKQKHCEIFMFTKRYEFVNKYLDEGGAIPKNLHLNFSAWKGLEMNNPHGVPEVHVKYLDGTTTASPNAKQFECPDSCLSCACNHCGCFGLQTGEEVILHEHGTLSVSKHSKEMKALKKEA